MSSLALRQLGACVLRQPRSFPRQIPSQFTRRSICQSQPRPFTHTPVVMEAELSEDMILVDEKSFSPNAMKVADDIAQLNMVEVAEVIKLLQKKFGWSDAMMQGMTGGGGGGGMPMMAAAGQVAGGAAAEEVKEEKTDFDLKLAAFDAGTKIKVIKEVRAITKLGLKEAKELVESAPCVILKGVKKEEAEEFVEKLKAVGGDVVLE